MKKVLPVVIIGAVIAGGVCSGYAKEKKMVKEVSPSVTAAAIPDGTLVILKGVAAREADSRVRNSEMIVIRTETGQTYLAENAPYVNTLNEKCIGKKVKIKGTTITKTSFKDYPGIYIKDILEVK